MPIRLTKIYTRGGDRGMTSLVGGARVAKDSERLEAYGTVDELNAVLGMVRTLLADHRETLAADFAGYDEMLRRIQNELFDLGSELATPPGAEYAGMHRMGEGEVRRLETEIDTMNQTLEPLASFTLPGGGKLSAHLHLARTVCRRAERRCWTLRRAEPATGTQLLVYLNRLSDHLFVQSRWIAKRLGEPEFLWDRGLRLGPKPAPGKLP